MKNCCLVIIAVLMAGCVMAEPRKKITFHVMDEESGVPLTNAQVTVFNKGWHVRQVDANGHCTFEGSSAVGKSFGWTGHTELEGYYKDSSGLEYSKLNHVLNRWEPWNPTVEVKLRKKMSPVPMVHKYTEWEPIPKTDLPLGYDLDVGDWIAPHGKGKRSDFLVTFSSYFQDSKKGSEACYVLTFPNEFDGIQAYQFPEGLNSGFKWPYKAPLDGYQSTLERFKHWDRNGTQDKSNYAGKNNYIFRVRSRQLEDGTIVACHGMTTGGLEFIPQGKVRLSYYFNPVENERSLEYNGENLLKK